MELTPVSRPEAIGDWLINRGLEQTGERQAKVSRPCDGPASASIDIEIRELSVRDRDQWAAVNISAWGVPEILGTWFGATVGCEGFRHFGEFDGDRLASTGAMYVTNNIAWLGFGATLADYRGSGFQTATLTRRLQDAAAMGCRIVHSETSADTPESVNPSLHNMLAIGFTQLYEKEFYAPLTTAAAEA